MNRSGLCVSTPAVLEAGVGKMGVPQGVPDLLVGGCVVEGPPWLAPGARAPLPHPQLLRVAGAILPITSSLSSCLAAFTMATPEGHYIDASDLFLTSLR